MITMAKKNQTKTQTGFFYSSESSLFLFSVNYMTLKRKQEREGYIEGNLKGTKETQEALLREEEKEI